MPEALPVEEPAPAAVDEQAAEPADPSEQPPTIGVSFEENEADIEAAYKRGEQAGQARADLERESMLIWLQKQLLQANDRLYQLHTDLNHRGTPTFCAFCDFDETRRQQQETEDLLAEIAPQREIWDAMSTESVSDLRTRWKATLARHGS